MVDTNGWYKDDDNVSIIACTLYICYVSDFQHEFYFKEAGHCQEGNGEQTEVFRLERKH